MKKVLKAYAKVNLGLHVGRKTKKGYHLIDTLIDVIDLYDEITIEDIDEDIIVVESDKYISPSEDNLCYKISKYLKDTYRVKKGIRIYIKKNIPMASGLGGGSSDAASVLAELNKRWNLGLSFKKTIKTGIKFGSDIPFFLQGKACRIKGIGGIVKTNVKIKPYFICLAVPGVLVKTKDVFDSFEHKQKNKMKDLLKAIKNGKLHLFNDLEDAADGLTKGIIKDVKARMKDFENIVMSGAGGSVCVFFDEEPSPSQKEEIRERLKDVKVIFAKTMGTV